MIYEEFPRSGTRECCRLILAIRAACDTRTRDWATHHPSGRCCQSLLASCRHDSSGWPACDRASRSCTSRCSVSGCPVSARCGRSGARHRCAIGPKRRPAVLRSRIRRDYADSRHPRPERSSIGTSATKGVARTRTRRRGTHTANHPVGRDRFGRRAHGGTGSQLPPDCPPVLSGGRLDAEGVRKGAAVPGRVPASRSIGRTPLGECIGSCRVCRLVASREGVPRHLRLAAAARA